MRKRDWNGTTGYTWEPDDADASYEFKVTGTVAPYVRASMYGGPDNLGWPEEGGDVEITAVKLVRIVTETEDRSPTEAERQKIEASFQAAIDKDADLFLCLEESLSNQASDDGEPDDSDYRYERRLGL